MLLDAERAGISATLQQSTDRIDEAVWSVLSRLAAFGRGTRTHGTPATISLSHSCRDLREYRETFPSWLVLQAFRITVE